mmetsp:Transcript_39325/g.88023  ORF Transcript_39325/g.88023 Transcript_39325/m.88023 type:complete len:259 (+) Transcript_39325:330-1106(+)
MTNMATGSPCAAADIVSGRGRIAAIAPDEPWIAITPPCSALRMRDIKMAVGLNPLMGPSVITMCWMCGGHARSVASPPPSTPAERQKLAMVSGGLNPPAAEAKAMAEAEAFGARALLTGPKEPSVAAGPGVSPKPEALGAGASEPVFKARSVVVPFCLGLLLEEELRSNFFFPFSSASLPSFSSLSFSFSFSFRLLAAPEDEELSLRLVLRLRSLPRSSSLASFAFDFLGSLLASSSSSSSFSFFFIFSLDFSVSLAF